jgi:murein tripeptide amidase MpaA
VRLTTDFEGARVDLVGIERRRATLRVPHDANAPRFRQWFAFDLTSGLGATVEARLENAGECTWGDAYGGEYRVYASEGGAWFRADSKLEKGTLVVRHQLSGTRVRLAYYPPFPASRIARLRRRARASGASVVELGRSPGGRPIEHFTFGGPGPSLRDVWFIAQQHPGEAMAGWFVEGLVEALSEPEPIAKKVLSRARVHVVPRMNPDGASLGNHRTNAAGIDLNRAWADAVPPVEVGCVRDAIKRHGADLFLDVHGDERLPFVFVQGGHKSVGGRDLGALERSFESAMLAATPDFQTHHKYPHMPGAKPTLAVATNWVQHETGCLAMILEMPFIDHLGKPDPRGFAPSRARRLGKSMLVGVLAALEAGARRR